VRARAKASFTDAKLEDADFGDNANLIGIDFTRAYLVGVKLQGADLREARLSEAMLGRANLAKAKLDSADLRSAKLDGADLASASLIDADLAGARLHGTDMTGAIFEPKSLPAIRDIAAAENLESLIYTKNPDALFELRKKFQDGGFRDQERKITYALKSRETQLLGENCRGARDFWNCVAYFLNKAGFDLTCQYGMDPWRPIKIAAGVWVVCTLLYFLFIRVGGQSGLFRINARPTDDPVGARSSPQADKIKPIALQGAKGSHFVGRLVWRELRVLGTAMFFSTMSSFNIGFREINFGRWLRMLTRQEFDIKAVGWARVVAGVQSLISFYMVVLWVLTYFGRPFE